MTEGKNRIRELGSVSHTNRRRGGEDIPIFLNEAMLVREFMNKRHLKRK